MKMNSHDVLSPVDINIDEDRSPASKRFKYSHSDETENLPNWSLNNDLELHEVIDQGVKKLEPETHEDDTIFKKDRPDFINVSCHSMSPETRQKQIALLECTLTKDTLERLNSGEWSTQSVPSMRTSPKINYFDSLSDEVILQILNWIPKNYLVDVSLACKRFNRLVQDESLWTRMDVSNRKIGKGRLGQLLSKQVIIMRLARSEIIHPPILPTQPVYSPEFRCRLTFLDLSMAEISTESLTDLFNKCQRLKKLSLEHVPVNDAVLKALAGNRDLDVINFAMCLGIAVPGLQFLLRNCRKIRELNISWTYVTYSTNKFLCENLPPTLLRLNLSGCRKLLKDADIAALVCRCPHLRELDLSDCTAITGETVKHLTALEDLNCIALSRCYAIDHESLLILKKMRSLLHLDIHGDHIDGNYVQRGLGDRVNINQFKFSSIARPTTGLKRTSIWNFRVRE